MKVFVTGATGFVGKHVAARLIADGHEPVCLVRDAGSDAAQGLRHLGARLVTGTITSPEDVIAGAGGTDATIHLVGIIFERRGASFQQVHVEGTINMLAAARTAGSSRFIHMSALGAGENAVSAYLKTKWTAEHAVIASGLDYTILRPSIIYGPGGEFIDMLLGQARRLPLLPVIGDGRYLMQPVSVSDVAQVFSAALTNQKSINRIYDVGGPSPLTYNEMLDTVCRALGKKRLKLHIPVAVMRLIAGVSEKTMSKPFLTTDQIAMLLQGSTGDISGLRQDFSTEPVDFPGGLASLLQA